MNPDGTADSNLVNLYEIDSGTMDAPRIFRFGVIDASAGGHTAGLKITSKAHDVIVYVDEIICGSENAIDVNNGCERVEIHVGRIVTTGKSKYVATVKGGCSHVEVSGLITGPGVKKCHVDLGNYSDQNKAETTFTTIEMACDDGQAVTYRHLNAAAPVLHGYTTFNPNYKKVLSVPLGPIGRAVFMFVFDILKRLNLA